MKPLPACLKPRFSRKQMSVACDLITSDSRLNNPDTAPVGGTSSQPIQYSSDPIAIFFERMSPGNEQFNYEINPLRLILPLD